MKQALMVAVALPALVAFPVAGWAQAKPNFSGSWTLDQTKSDPPPARGQRGGGGGGRGGGSAAVAVTISQSATQITVDRTMGPGAQTAETSAVYKLDGSESTNASGDVFLSRSKVSWDGAKLVITTAKDMGLGPNGAMSEDSTEVYSLEGGVLTVLTTTRSTPSTSNSSQTRKLVYNKKP